MPEFFNISAHFPAGARILVAPLDWGLGHATRCIPLIHNLISEQTTNITIAASGSQKAILEEAFPQLPFISIPLYNIQYSKNRAATIAGLAFSVPHIVKTIRRESQWLKELLKTNDFDAVISDNRYGLSHPGLKCFFITHQLQVKTAFGSLADRLVQKQLYRWINRFTECWVPDYGQAPGLAGELSHPAVMPAVPVRYLGPLTRIQDLPPTGDTQLLVLLSGPEPQRTLLEKKITEQWRRQPGKSLVLVRGLPGARTGRPAGPDLPNARVYDHLPAKELSQEIANARTIFCRSGYSSVMDLVPLGKNCVMVPTPGQTEQEYLARLLSSTGQVRSYTQGEFDPVRHLFNTC